MPRKLFLPATLILLGAASACSLKRSAATIPVASFPRQQLIAEMKDFQKTLGFQDQRNFVEYSAAPKAFYRCYHTGKLELPASYEQLRLTEGNVAGCSLDEEKYDVFFYPIEAVASGSAPVTEALTQAPLERLLVVVPHEDFHNQDETEKSAPEIGEAAATLIGFLAASQFAHEKYGPASQISQSLDREAPLFLQKAGIINAYFDRLRELYASVRTRKISRSDALARKEKLFAQLQQECAAITPDPVSFNPCPGAMNNAGLAFDRSYTRYYPLLFDLSVAHAQDARATIAALKRILAGQPRTKTDLIRALGLSDRPQISTLELGQMAHSMWDWTPGVVK